jgi:hypothetical protein
LRSGLPSLRLVDCLWFYTLEDRVSLCGGMFCVPCCCCCGQTWLTKRRCPKMRNPMLTGFTSIEDTGTSPFYTIVWFWKANSVFRKSNCQQRWYFWSGFEWGGGDSGFSSQHPGFRWRQRWF